MLLAHERKSKRWQKYTKNNKTATILTIIFGKNKHFCRPSRFLQDFCDLEVAFYGVSHGLDGLDGLEGLDGLDGMDGMEGLDGLEGLEGPRLSRGIDDQGGTRSASTFYREIYQKRLGTSVSPCPTDLVMQNQSKRKINS